MKFLCIITRIILCLAFFYFNLYIKSNNVMIIRSRIINNNISLRRTLSRTTIITFDYKFYQSRFFNVNK